MDILAPPCQHENSEQWQHNSGTINFEGDGYRIVTVPRCCIDWYTSHGYMKTKDEHFVLPETSTWINVERDDQPSKRPKPVYAPPCQHTNSPSLGRSPAQVYEHGNGIYHFSVPNCCLSWYINNRYKLKIPNYPNVSPGHQWSEVYRSDNIQTKQPEQPEKQKCNHPKDQKWDHEYAFKYNCNDGCFVIPRCCLDEYLQKGFCLRVPRRWPKAREYPTTECQWVQIYLPCYGPHCYHENSEKYDHLSAFTSFFGGGHYNFSVPKCCLNWFLKHHFTVKAPYYWTSDKKYPSDDEHWINIVRNDNTLDIRSL